MAKSSRGRVKAEPQFLEDDPSTGYLPGKTWPSVRYGLVSLLLAAVLVFCIEWIVRGDFAGTVSFFLQPFKPGWTTIILFALIMIGLDAVLGRSHQSLMMMAPLTLSLAFVGHQKSLYLGDPLYPTDFLYARQIFALLPLLVRERPMTAVAMVVGIVLGLSLLVFGWRMWRRRVPALSHKGRLARLTLAVPLLAFFVSIMDYATFSWTRDRLQIIPMMWDQKENYASNGFALAFALNVPMAHVTAPPGYSEKAIAAIERPDVAASMPDEKPDIIMVMSESFWDPAILPNVSITPDPIPTVRELRSGSMFSPEFGGMTANVEFEALTGFSNAFLPAGSIPYQQYVRAPVPSLATFLKSQGYATRAIHPGTNWFWNRTPVYADFGFDDFKSEENLPAMEKRGPLASDASMTDEIIREADAKTIALGEQATANKRVIRQYIIPGVCETCQLVMGVTTLEEGSIWNTMPAHTHDRRCEIYLYFDVPADARVFHLMGEPQETRHLVVANEQAILSPGWSIHSGVGTRAYSFIWGMGGDNVDYTDMDMVATGDLR